MNTIFIIFFGVIALVLGLFVALLFISALTRGAESMSEAMAMNPPKFMGASFAGLAIFYLTNIRALSVLILVIGLILSWRQAKHSFF